MNSKTARRASTCCEAPSIEELALEGREQALTQGVVVGVAHRAHRGPDPHLAAVEAEGDRRLPTALIGVMDHLGRAARPMAMFSSVCKCAAMAQSTTQRLQASSTKARKMNPAQVVTR